MKNRTSTSQQYFAKCALTPPKGVIVQRWVETPVDKRLTNVFDKMLDYSLHCYRLGITRGVIKDTQRAEIEAYINSCMGNVCVIF